MTPSGFSASFSAPNGDGGTIQIIERRADQCASTEQLCRAGRPAGRAGRQRSRSTAQPPTSRPNQLTMTMNQGLFDIAVDVSAAPTIRTALFTPARPPGRRSEPVRQPQVYMVAVPKNQALTMLLGGTVGFDAGTARATITARSSLARMVCSRRIRRSRSAISRQPGGPSRIAMPMPASRLARRQLHFATSTGSRSWATLTAYVADEGSIKLRGPTTLAPTVGRAAISLYGAYAVK